jgi:hypothetical protein
MVQPSSADNKQPEPFYVDEGQLELVDVPKLEVKTSPNMGGWKPDPVR